MSIAMTVGRSTRFSALSAARSNTRHCRAALSVAAAVALLAAAAMPLSARTIVVDVRGGHDFPTIYQGVYNAADGDTVLVKSGIYKGDWNRDIEFGGRGIKLLSDRGPSMTWIDCEGLGRAFKFESGEDSTAVVRGFTIRNGSSSYGGSAILAGGTSPTLLDLVIEDCRTPGGYWSVRGGAIRCNASAAPIIRNVIFSGNTGGQGGGILCYGGASPLIENCTFAGNRGTYGGGAVYCDASYPVIRHCVLSHSTAGGGIACVEGSLPTVEACIIYGNAGGDEPCGDVVSWLSEDPLFCDAGSGDFEVCDESPCLPENNPFGVLVGARGAGPCPCPPAQPPKVWHVPGDFATILEALEATSYGDTVLVKPGTYAENQLSIPWGVYVKATEGPDVTTVEAIDPHCVYFGERLSGSLGDIAVADTAVARTAAARVGPTAVLDGFTLTGATGGAIWITAASPVIRNCAIAGNSAYEGGAIHCDSYSSPLIEDCRLTKNTGLESSSGHGGGAVSVHQYAAPEFVRTVIADNTAVRGGGIYINEGGSASLSQCTVAANAAEVGGGLYVEAEAAALIDASVVAHGGAGEPIHCDDGIDVTTMHSVIFGNSWGDSLCGMHADNIFDDPLFCDWSSGDFSVCSESPCLPQNNPFGIQLGVEGDGGCPCPAGGTALRVPQDYGSITEAAGVAVYGDTIIVSAGTYAESEIMLPPGVPLLSVAGPESTTIAVGLGTALRLGEPARSDDAERLAGIGGRADRAGTLVRGFTVTGATDSGVLIRGRLVHLENMVIEFNAASALGGGVRCYDADVHISNSRFVGNAAVALGTGAGGALYCRDSSVRVTGVEFVDNRASLGGAVRLRASTSETHEVRFENCTFLRNSADEGAAISTFGNADIGVKSCTFVGNEGNEGSSIWTLYSSARVENSVFAFAPWGPSFECGTNSFIDLTDCVIHAEPDTQTLCATTNNVMFANPLFCDLLGGNLNVCEDSPCLPENGYFDELAGAHGDGSCVCPASVGAVLRVPDDWPRVADALARATAADTVLIAPGIYPEHDLSIPWGVTVIGEGGAETTVIDAEGQGSVFRAGMMPDGRAEGISTHLEGLTITGASSSGLYATGGRPVIVDCVFTGNAGTPGGAMRLRDGCDAVITNVQFIANESPDHDGYGGAVHCAGWSNAEFTRCVFIGNSSERGAAIACRSSAPSITNCTFAGNTSVRGSSIHCRDGSKCSVTNSIFAFGEGSPPVYLDDDDIFVAEYSLVYGNAGADTLAGTQGEILREDPLFCDWPTGAVGLQAHSRGLSHNNPWFEAIGARQQECGPLPVIIHCDGTGDFPTLQAAIDVSDHGDVIIAGVGVFSGEGNRDIDFGGKRLKLRTALGPEQTTIDCEGLGRAFRFASGEDTLSVVRGFTITAGSEGDGGAVLASGSSPLIEDCIIRDCSAERGGAIACANNASPLLRCIEITGNEADRGGGVYSSGGEPMLRDIVFRANSARENGGGLDCRANTHLDLRRAAFIDNSAAGSGGGVHCMLSAPLLRNVTFVGNAAPTGGGISSINASPHLNGCIVSFTTSGEAMYCEGTLTPYVEHCVVYGNAEGDELCGTDGGDNFFVDPLFCDLLGEDLTLCENSECFRPVAPESHIGMYGAGCDSCGTTTDVPHAEPVQVSRLHLSALPNPFTGETTVHFELPAAAGDVLLRVYNLRGQAVRTLAGGTKPAGRWQVSWDGGDDSGQRVASGVYFCRLTAAGESATTRIVLLH